MEIPDGFGSIEDALTHFRLLFQWYNNEHRHSGIAMLTPSDLHSGHGAAVLAARGKVMAAAYVLNPARFVNGKPTARKRCKPRQCHKPRPSAVLV